MTTPKYAIVPATAEHAAECAANMRDEDRAEVLAMSGHSPEQAVAASIERSEDVWAAMVDGKVLCLFGVGRATLISDLSCPWMLSTNELPRHARQFARHSKGVVAYWRERHPHLMNAVDARYQTSLRWLRWLGFTIHEAEPMGPSRRLFHRATIGD